MNGVCSFGILLALAPYLKCPAGGQCSLVSWSHQLALEWRQPELRSFTGKAGERRWVTWSACDEPNPGGASMWQIGFDKCTDQEEIRSQLSVTMLDWIVDRASRKSLAFKMAIPCFSSDSPGRLSPEAQQSYTVYLSPASCNLMIPDLSNSGRVENTQQATTKKTCKFTA